jgi:dihydrofolate synthase / folylpolyglutamate synthase
MSHHARFKDVCRQRERMTEKNLAYQEALDYLYSFVDYSLTRGFRFSPEKFDLGRMVAFLELLGNPHRSYPVIHVAGTKGKGSTAALIASALQAAGYRVGFYTSPHLQEYTERIQVNGQSISESRLVHLVEYVKPYVADVERLTTFEITTAIGFLYFAREKVDVAVVEVGLGGRLDATNVVDPLLSVITSLSMDHMSVLGDTLEKIAFEKAGIIKSGKPVVSAIQKPEALQVIEQIAGERGCPLILVGRDSHYASGTHSLDGQSLEVWNNQGRRAHLTIPLLGQHQVENAATAFAALQVAAEKGLIVSDEALRRGFASVRWPARFEVLRKEPLLIVDSAHNRDSALRLRQAMDDYLPGRPVVLLFGASEDKDIEGMFAELMPRVRYVVATQSVHPRAMEAAQLVELADKFGRPAEAVMPLEKALAAALKQAGSDAAVLAAGSLFIAAAVRETWHKMENQPENM